MKITVFSAQERDDLGQELEIGSGLDHGWCCTWYWANICSWNVLLHTCCVSTTLHRYNCSNAFLTQGRVSKFGFVKILYFLLFSFSKWVTLYVCIVMVHPLTTFPTCIQGNLLFPLLSGKRWFRRFRVCIISESSRLTLSNLDHHQMQSWVWPRELSHEERWHAHSLS